MDVTKTTHLLGHPLSSPVHAIIRGIFAIGLGEQNFEATGVISLGVRFTDDTVELGEMTWLSPHAMYQDEEMNGAH